MAETITIPRLSHDEEDFSVVGKPGWFATVNSKGEILKPIIRCNCGHLTGIGLHHVHSDGTITQSFYHKKGTEYPEDPNGCEWHVHLKLDNWTGQDIPPDPK